MTMDEMKLDEFFGVLSRERDPRLVRLLQAVAALNTTALRAVLEVVHDQYSEDLAEILEDYEEEEEDERDYRRDRDHGGFGDYEEEDLYESDLLFDDEMEAEENLETWVQVFLANPEAVHPLLILIAQNKDMDKPLLALITDSDSDSDYDFDFLDLDRVSESKAPTARKNNSKNSPKNSPQKKRA